MAVAGASHEAVDGCAQDCSGSDSQLGRHDGEGTGRDTGGAGGGIGGRALRSTRTWSNCRVSRGSSSRTAGHPPVSSRGGASSAQRVAASIARPGVVGQVGAAAGWPGCA